MKVVCAAGCLHDTKYPFSTPVRQVRWRPGFRQPAIQVWQTGPDSRCHNTRNGNRTPATYNSLPVSPQRDQCLNRRKLPTHSIRWESFDLVLCDNSCWRWYFERMKVVFIETYRNASGFKKMKKIESLLTPGNTTSHFLRKMPIIVFDSSNDA